MKELNKKVFKTIFVILSLFLLLGIGTYNIQTYKKEYENIKRNLTIIEDKNNFKQEEDVPEPKDFNGTKPEENRSIDNMMIMDYEVYTVKLENKKIDRIIYHSSDVSDIDIEKVAESIIKKKEELHIGNLYNNKYAYNYNQNTIVIINTKTMNKKLLLTMMESLLLLFVLEIVIYYVSKSLTKKLIRPAEESFQKQKDFIADASHELKTPLAVIMASSDELKKDKKNQKYVENIKYESERMNTLIKGLLDLSKLENKVSMKSYKEENLSKIIERTSLTFEAIAYEKKVKIDTQIEEGMLLKCSKEEIERVLAIILDNAIKHSYENSSIIVQAKKNKNQIHIEIINSGDPIQPGEEEKIFERFYRGDKSRNREANRYGLGLAIAKNIVINHNGTIKAYSKEGKTTFQIILKK